MLTQKTIHNLTFTKFNAPRLPEFVKDITEVRGYGVETTKRLYPRNTPEILINLAKPIRGRMDGKKAVIDGCTMQGSKTKFVEAWHPEFCHFLSIRFIPNGYYKFLGIPQKSLTDHVINLEEILNEDTKELTQRLQEAPDVSHRFRILTNWLRRAECTTETDSTLVSDFIINNLNENPGLTVKELTDKTGYTRKHLVHRFKEEAGLTIKEYQKINRIYRVLKEIQNTECISWAQLACTFGFYDQSHLIRDFKQYTGLTPTDFLKQQAAPKSLVG
ncbi:MAG: AraC family transcriptional regulator [Balneolaceae bacterium]|nr:AraC family transcriptional regulator [Balneolaceae bacterium]